MGWSIGWDSSWQRDVGYGVPAICDHPGCGAAIDRGLGYVCGGDPFGGEQGCGLYFCELHLGGIPQRCGRCLNDQEPFTPTADVSEWVRWKLTDESWAEWRSGNPDTVAKMGQHEPSP